jgi:hypothetical protein
MFRARYRATDTTGEPTVRTAGADPAVGCHLLSTHDGAEALTNR